MWRREIEIKTKEAINFPPSTRLSSSPRNEFEIHINLRHCINGRITLVYRQQFFTWWFCCLQMHHLGIHEADKMLKMKWMKKYRNTEIVNQMKITIQFETTITMTRRENNVNKKIQKRKKERERETWKKWNNWSTKSKSYWIGIEFIVTVHNQRNKWAKARESGRSITTNRLQCSTFNPLDKIYYEKKKIEMLTSIYTMANVLVET